MTDVEANDHTTFATRLTSSGRSAVAVIGLRGPKARVCIEACFRPARKRDYAPNQIRYGVWITNASQDHPGDEVGESIVVSPVENESFELHAHGGVAAIRKIMHSLHQLGVQEIDSETFNKLEPQEPLTLEAETALIGCSTRRNAAIAVSQIRAGLLQWVDSLAANPHTLKDIQSSARNILRHQSVGSHLVSPYRVVLAGPPNVGKSSLINRLLGFDRAITHDAPGTTRDVIECDTVIAGLNFRFSDTAGIRIDGDAIEREGIRRGALAIAKADLVIAVASPQCIRELTDLRETMQNQFPNMPTIEVLNQADRLNEVVLVNQNELPFLHTIAVAPPELSFADDGIQKLSDAIVDQVRPSEPDAKQPIPLNSRHIHWLHQVVECTEMDHALDCLMKLKDGSQ